MKSKNTRAQAYIRQLCCLGLAKEALATELLHAVKKAIPSSSNIYMEIDVGNSSGMIVPEYEICEALAFLAAESRRLVTLPMSQRVLHWYAGHAVFDDPRIMADDFYAGDFYNLVWRPYDHHHTMQCLVSHHQGRVATLLLGRARAARAFSADEKALFARLIPYFRHGLRGRCRDETDYDGAGDAGLLVMDPGGRLVYASDKARKLLLMARYPAYPVGSPVSFEAADIPPALGRLCRNLDGIFQGRAAAPPVAEHINGRGRFLFRAHWLDPIARDGGGLIGVTVEHQEPAALQLLRRIGDLPLSPVQMEVCLMLARNQSQESIARALDIGLATARDHIRKIYLKLGVHQRDELTRRLRAAQA